MIKSWVCVAFGFSMLCASAAKADLHTFHLTVTGEVGGTRSITVQVYELGKSRYKVRAQAAQSNGLNVAQVANANKSYPLAVSAGDFGQQASTGLISVQGAFVSRLALAESMPNLLCFRQNGFDIRPVAADIGKTLPSIASDCLVAIQTPSLLIESGRRLSTSSNPVGWMHVLIGRSTSSDRIVVVEGLISPAALTAFLGVSSIRCQSAAGTVTTQRARVQVSGNGAAAASCSLGLTDVAILNSGRTTGVVHYGIRLSGDDASSPPVTLLFDD